MSFQQFMQTVTEELRMRLPDTYIMTPARVEKNNGVIYEGVTISNPLYNAAPTLYLNPYYGRYLEGIGIDAIVDDLMDTFTRNKPKKIENLSRYEDYSQVKDCIIYKLVNRKRNRKLLQQVPFMPFHDLAIVFQVLVKDVLPNFGTILIREDLRELWGVSLEELYRDASRNTPLLLPFETRGLGSFLREMAQQLSVELPFDPEPEMSLLYLTNRNMTNGAAVILYDGLLRQVADRRKKDLILIPSSIHEWLAVPYEEGDDPEFYRNMLLEVNETELQDDELLSDQVYFYSRKKDLLYPLRTS